MKSDMKMKVKKTMKTFLIIVIVFVILLLIIVMNHKIHLKIESELRSPLGQMVEVDGHNMSIYIEGTGETTIVFMSGSGTCSPIPDF